MSLLDEVDTRARETPAVQIRGRLSSEVVALDRGGFDAERLLAGDQTIGLLILDGLIIVQLGAGRSQAACLIGPEDLLRPWDVTAIALNRAVHWTALTRVRALRFPPERQHGTPARQAVPALLSRATRTTRWLLAQALILGDSRVEDRLLMSFSLWADRWGKVTPGGIWIELPLTHELIGQLVGARRPTATLALKALEAEHLLTRHPRGGWLLDRRTYQLNGGLQRPSPAGDRQLAG